MCILHIFSKKAFDCTFVPSNELVKDQLSFLRLRPVSGVSYLASGWKRRKQSLINRFTTDYQSGVVDGSRSS